MRRRYKTARAIEGALAQARKATEGYARLAAVAEAEARALLDTNPNGLDGPKQAKLRMLRDCIATYSRAADRQSSRASKLRNRLGEFLTAPMTIIDDTVAVKL